MDLGFIQLVHHICVVIHFRWLASKIRFVRSSMFARWIMTKCILCRALPWMCHPSIAFFCGTTELWNLWNTSNFHVCETGVSKLLTLDPSQIHITKLNSSKFTLIDSLRPVLVFQTMFLCVFVFSTWPDTYAIVILYT